LHFFELYRLYLDSHAHGLGQEFLDIGGGPDIETVAVEADRANIETTESRPASTSAIFGNEDFCHRLTRASTRQTRRISTPF